MALIAKHKLHHCGAEPSIKFATDFRFDADKHKSARLVQRPRGLRASLNASDDGVEPTFTCHFDQVIHQRSADSEAVVLA